MGLDLGSRSPLVGSIRGVPTKSRSQKQPVVSSERCPHERHCGSFPRTGNPSAMTPIPWIGTIVFQNALWLYPWDLECWQVTLP